MAVEPLVAAGAVGARPERRRLVPRLGLRARVILAFSIGALLLAVVLSGIVLAVTRTNLVNQREATATSRVFNNAQIVRSTFTPDTDAQDALQSLQTPGGAKPILYERQKAISGEPTTGWTAPDPEFGQSALPESLREVVLSGQASKMRFVHTTGSKSLAVGTPIADLDGAYFEIVSLDDLDDTLSSISFTLFGASIATVLAGAAFGWYSSRQILRPLGEVGVAARAIAGGELDTRISAPVDRDLEPIITSFNGMASAMEARIEKDLQFASDVSHELRSPLMTLQASIEVLENNKDSLPDRAQSALGLLGEDLDRFRELVEDLLEISRFDAGVMALELDEVLLTQFVEYAVRDAGFRVPVVHGPDLPVDDEFGDVVLALDKRRIARVIANLLTNAEKYGDGPTQVLLDGSSDIVHISVDDAGDGVPPEDRERIFERFNRAGIANKRGTAMGVGLGLALVAEHVALHGGRIEVDDAPSGGARFRVSLPVVEAPPRDDVDSDLA